jgi:glycosyltransferase involved in cell wall biosynthesis
MKPDSTPVFCFLDSYRVWGGGQQVSLSNAGGLARRGFKVFLGVRRGSALHEAAEKLRQREPELGLRLRLFDFNIGNLDFLNPFKILPLAGFLRRERVTAIIAALPRDMKAAVAAAGLMPSAERPGLYYRRDIAIPVRSGWLNRFFYRALDGLVVNSRETARNVLKSGRLINPDQVHLIYYGLDTEDFDRVLASAPSSWPPFQGRTGRPLVLGNAGRLTPQKGQKYLLHLCAALKRQGFRHRLIIAGTGQLKAELSALAVRLGLTAGEGLDADREVCFAGFLENMAPFWRAIDVFVLSSLWEGFGYVLAEAMLAEKPLCALDCNSMPELVLDGRNGYLAEAPGPGETDEAVGGRLAEVVRRFYGEPEAMPRLGRAGRAFCLENFTRDRALDQLEAVLVRPR